MCFFFFCFKKNDCHKIVLTALYPAAVSNVKTPLEGDMECGSIPAEQSYQTLCGRYRGKIKVYFCNRFRRKGTLLRGARNLGKSRLSRVSDSVRYHYCGAQGQVNRGTVDVKL